MDPQGYGQSLVGSLKGMCSLYINFGSPECMVENVVCYREYFPESKEIQFQHKLPCYTKSSPPL